MENTQEKFSYSLSLQEPPNFTDRQLSILKLLAEEKTSNEIAGLLQMKPRTVEQNIERMREKVGAKKAIGLVVYALRHKIIE